MGPELSRRLGAVLGSRTVPMAVRLQVIAAAATAQTWDDLPDDTKRLIEDLDRDDDQAAAVEPGTARSLLAAFDRGGDPDPSPGEIASWARAAGADTHPGGEELRHYWTQTPEGLAQWANSPHPWTALYDHLITKIKNPEKTKRIVSAWYEVVFGGPVGWKKGKDPDGPG